MMTTTKVVLDFPMSVSDFRKLLSPLVGQTVISVSGQLQQEDQTKWELEITTEAKQKHQINNLRSPVKVVQ